MVPPHPPHEPDPTPDPADGDEPAVGPVDDPGPGAGRRWRRTGYVAGSVLGLLIVVVIGSLFVTTPYYRLAPDSVRTTEELIEVRGADAYTDDAGVIGYTTVSLGPATVFELVTGWMDDDVEILTKEEAIGDVDPDENREANLQMMDSSKQLAAAVALTELGYDVEQLGTGALVVQVVPGSAADGVLARGDTVVAVDGQPVERNDELGALLDGRSPGDVVTLRVERPVDLEVPAGADGATTTSTSSPATTSPAPEVDRPDGAPMAEVTAFDVEVELGARDDDPDAVFLGVSSLTRDQQYDLPFTVTIDSGSVGGPSAGLAFTLGVIDVLTPGSLTGGLKVATTGTIQPDGTVGEVGGVRQKTAAVRASGADVFLVPTAELADARAAAGGDLEVIGVDDLTGALTALDGLGGDTSGVRAQQLADGAGS